MRMRSSPRSARSSRGTRGRPFVRSRRILRRARIAASARRPGSGSRTRSAPSSMARTAKTDLPEHASCLDPARSRARAGGAAALERPRADVRGRLHLDQCLPHERHAPPRDVDATACPRCLEQLDDARLIHGERDASRSVLRRSQRTSPVAHLSGRPRLLRPRGDVNWAFGVPWQRHRQRTEHSRTRTPVYGASPRLRGEHRRDGT